MRETPAIDDLPPHQIPAAARILAQAMRDNPLHQRVFGSNTRRLEPLLHAGFCRVLRQQIRKGRVLGAQQSGQLVAVTGMYAPGSCLPSLRERLALLGPLMRAGALHRLPGIHQWLRIWSHYDPDFAHWHLGPAGVARDVQGMGIGGNLLAAVCEHLDSCESCGYLETDKWANVRLYQRAGFRVRAQTDVLGVTNWFMLRDATTRHSPYTNLV